MPYLPLAPPAGLYRAGTIYQSKNRWYDANLIRFQQDQVKPIGGWQLRSAAAAFSGAARCALSWRDNATPQPSRWVGVGTSSHLYIQDEAGSNHNITPTGYTAGRDSAVQNLGYGGGTYGTGFYGTPRPDTVPYQPATVWSLESWGEDLVGCADTDGKVYLWSLNTSAPAAVVSAAPTGCAGIVVTQEGFLLALGASGNGRRVQWCDERDLTTWTPSATNQAGDYDLMTPGTLQCGKALAAGALLLTDVDAWTATYIGTPLVYGFQRVGAGCGPIAKGAIATMDSVAAWMGEGPCFWVFDGQVVQPLDCEVLDYLSDMNASQKSKISAVLLDGPGEVWWFYPSGSSTENDRYVCWAFRESQRLGRNIWTFGQLARTCGTGKGVMPTPLMVSPTGYLYEHETGLNFDGVLPYIESGPIEIGQGDYMAEIQRLIPDELQDGNLTCQFFGRLWPDGAEFASNAFLLTSPTEILFQAREIRTRFTQAVSTSWRLGTNRLELIQGDPL